MRLRYCAVFFCLVSAVGSAQNQGHRSKPSQNSIPGIKVFSSSFDGRSVQLDFMNDSPVSITAWGYCVNATKTNSSDPAQNFCTWTDAVPVVVDRQVHEQVTLKPSVSVCPDCEFIRPGQHKTISANFAVPVASAEIEINLLVGANGTMETSGKEGVFAAQEISRSRQNMLAATQTLAVVGKGILDDHSNAHPTASMISELQSRAANEPGLQRDLHHLQRPGWRKGNPAEFVPEDERGYLTQFVTEQQLKAAEFSKHQVQEVHQ